jgi:hypothetical protein
MPWLAVDLQNHKYCPCLDEQMESMMDITVRVSLHVPSSRQVQIKVLLEARVMW